MRRGQMHTSRRASVSSRSLENSRFKTGSVPQSILEDMELFGCEYVNEDEVDLPKSGKARHDTLGICGEGYTQEGQYIVHEPDPYEFPEEPYLAGFYPLNFELDTPRIIY